MNTKPQIKSNTKSTVRPKTNKKLKDQNLIDRIDPKKIKYDENIPVPGKLLPRIYEFNPIQEVIKNIPLNKSYLFEYLNIDHLEDPKEFTRFRLRISRSILSVNQYLSQVEEESKVRFVSRIEVFPVRDRITSKVLHHKGGVRVWRVL